MRLKGELDKMRTTLDQERETALLSLRDYHQKDEHHQTMTASLLQEMAAIQQSLKYLARSSNASQQFRISLEKSRLRTKP